jgi:hypothetical protein
MLALDLGKYNYGKAGRQRKVMLHSGAKCRSETAVAVRSCEHDCASLGQSRRGRLYFGAGAAGGAGVCAGWVFTGCDLMPCRTELGPVRREA